MNINKSMYGILDRDNIIKINKWQDFYYKVSLEGNMEKFITENLIRNSLSSFKNLLLSFISGKNYSSVPPTEDGNIKSSATGPNLLKLLILFKVKTVNNQIRTISYCQIINIEEFNKLYDLFIEFWNLKSEEYFIAPYSDIIYTFKVLDNSNLETKLLKPKKEFKKDNRLEIGKMTFGGFDLPTTMDFTYWGKTHFLDDNNAIVYKNKSYLEYHIKLFDNYQAVDLKLDDNILLSFKDQIMDKTDLSTFSRKLKNQEYIFEQGKLVLKKIEKKVQFIKKTRKSNYLSNKFITMDLETRIINEEMTSYCVSIYDGKNFKSFYLTDYLPEVEGYNAEKEMLRDSIKYLMRRKYHNHKVYLHNFSKFDAIFLLTIMTDLSDKVFPVIREGQFIDLRLEFGDFYKLYFRDSLLLLPASLRSLAKNFNVENKGLFPYKFVNNKNVSLDYKGEVPDIKYFDNISEQEYYLYCKESNYTNKTWNIRDETIKYCELDCLVLYQILDEFSKKIFVLFRMDVFKYPTLSSLAFAIYRSKFLNNYKIPIIQGEMFEFIKKSYTGGSVDVYKPKSNNKVYRYDVNSLYPYVMKQFPMPIGKPIYFEGDIINYYSNFIKETPVTFSNLGENNYSCEDVRVAEKPFGIFEVDIISPDYIKIPILQTRVNTDKGYRTIAPIGNWSGHYFSDELYNAQKYGYKFKVKRGYLFEKGDIFSEYVDFLYDIKKNSGKGSPNYIISKLLLNSLYGRLGMNPQIEQHLILSQEKAANLYSSDTNSKIITNVLDLKNGKELISFFNNTDLRSGDIKDFDVKNISIVVSSVVTASARIFMSQFKLDKKITIYYTDTDSIDIDNHLDSKFVGNELGEMKLEHIFEDAVFLAPKLYGGITKDYEYVRIKGLKNPIKYKELIPLLKKDSKLEIKQEKWYSDVSNGKFHIKDEIYTLMVTDNKRKLIYNEDNILYDTGPIKLKDGKIID